MPVLPIQRVTEPSVAVAARAPGSTPAAVAVVTTTRRQGHRAVTPLGCRGVTGNPAIFGPGPPNQVATVVTRKAIGPTEARTAARKVAAAEGVTGRRTLTGKGKAGAPRVIVVFSTPKDVAPTPRVRPIGQPLGRASRRPTVSKRTICLGCRCTGSGAAAIRRTPFTVGWPIPRARRSRRRPRPRAPSSDGRSSDPRSTTPRRALTPSLVRTTILRARRGSPEAIAKATTSEPTAGTTLTGETAPTVRNPPTPHPTTSNGRRAAIFKTVRELRKLPCLCVAAPSA